MTRKYDSARIPDANEPSRAPDGEVDGYYFWLGEEAPLDDDSEGDQLDFGFGDEEE